MAPEIYIKSRKEHNGRVNVIVPQIMLVLAGGFILELALLSLFYQALLEQGKFIESTPGIELLHIAGIALFGAAFLILGTRFKKIQKRKLAIYIIISILYLLFISGYMYNNLIVLPQQGMGESENGNNVNPVNSFIFYGFLVFIQIVPIIVMGVHIRWHEKKMRLAEEGIK